MSDNLVTYESILISSKWHEVIRQGFDVNVLTFSELPKLYFSLFRQGPFRLAILNFPTGLLQTKYLTPELLSALSHRAKQQGVHALRISFPDYGRQYFEDDVLLPVTQIKDLGTWSVEKLSSDIRYKIRKSQRMGLTIRAALFEDAEHIYQLYCHAVQRNSGQLRYNLKYFTALLKQSQLEPRIQVLMAINSTGTPCGFIVAIHDGFYSHYLHGGFSAKYSSLRPGYLLMSQAIETAREYNAHVFNMMASPAEQVNLIHFKEKWRGDTELHRTITIPLGYTGVFLKWLMRLHQLILRYCT